MSRLETRSSDNQDVEKVISQVERALSHLSDAVKAASKKARNAEELIQQQKLEITNLKTSNRKFDLRIQTMESEMKRVSK